MTESGGIEAFLQREVLPHAPDAWYKPDTVKIGYEISFTRYFYKPQPMRPLTTIRDNILASNTKPKASSNKSSQFIIPIYQRTYSWEEAQCQQLWDDIMRAGRREDINAHFVGSVVYIEKGLYHVSDQSPLLVIDGQQRLTTVSLILEALARKLKDGGEPSEGFSDKKIRNYYLLNELEEGEKRYKLILTLTDKDTLVALMDRLPEPQDYSLQVRNSFRFFKERISELDDLKPLCVGLAKLMIVDVSLTRGQDNPQRIFESMNSTGRELSQADLIRNFVLMGLEHKHQTRLYENHWRPMEIEFGQEAYGKHFDGFMRHYLTLKTGTIPKIGDVYEEFKIYTRETEDDVDILVGDIHKFASHYCAMALAKEPDNVLASAFENLRELRVDVAYPLLLKLYDDYKEGLLNRDDFARTIRLIENYIFRRAVCAIPTNSLNKTFANFGKNIKEEHYLESVRAHFLLLPSYRRFPGDEEFISDLKKRDLYNFRGRNYWLRHLENYDRKEQVRIGEHTIEHIMPQHLSDEWRDALGLGEDSEGVHQTWLHTLGNLTLTGYNSEYSNHPFAKKRDMEGGFRESPLHLNKGLAQLDEWNISEIQRRADRLAQLATNVWNAPQLSPEVLDTYVPKKEVKPTGYAINDHKFLDQAGVTQQLFEVFRERVLALDPEITEEFFKNYVAYKAETNFVDLIGQSDRLKLVLNMDFHELHDPTGVAVDVTNKGTYGNGNAELVVSSKDEIPYAIGLVRQSLEKQMGE